jgi:hypothetical protein
MSLVHPAYNPYFFSLFFQLEQCFSLTTNQPTLFSVGLSAQPNGAEENIGDQQKKLKREVLKN